MQASRFQFANSKETRQTEYGTCTFSCDLHSVFPWLTCLMPEQQQGKSSNLHFTKPLITNQRNVWYGRSYIYAYVSHFCHPRSFKYLAPRCSIIRNCMSLMVQLSNFVVLGNRVYIRQEDCNIGLLISNVKKNNACYPAESVYTVTSSKNIHRQVKYWESAQV